jgi:hypothetical protein
MQTWNEPETSTIHLADGQEVKAPVNGFSPEDGSDYVLIDGREIKVMPLPDLYRYLGYGEIVSITLQSGETVNTVLTPEEYRRHVAWVDVGAIRRASVRLSEPGAIITESEERITAIFDQSSGTWREMTDEEYEKERRAWESDAKDMAQIEREWRSYRNEGLGNGG